MARRAAAAKAIQNATAPGSIPLLVAQAAPGITITASTRAIGQLPQCSERWPGRWVTGRVTAADMATARLTWRGFVRDRCGGPKAPGRQPTSIDCDQLSITS